MTSSCTHYRSWLLAPVQAAARSAPVGEQLRRIYDVFVAMSIAAIGRAPTARASAGKSTPTAQASGSGGAANQAAAAAVAERREHVTMNFNQVWCLL